MLPPKIVQLSQEIHAVDPLSQSIAYNYDTWCNHLYPYEELDYIYSVFPNKISRGNIVALSKEAVETCDIGDIRKLFLATMIWGYGTTGYGPWRTAEMFSTRNFSYMIENAFNLVLRNRILDAYTQFNIKRCGPPYFTKYLYFIGYGAGLDLYPLILDTRVWEALRDRVEIDTTLFVKKSTWWYPEGYLRYVRTMHHWAATLNCEAHNIEYLLFKLGRLN